ncbi:Serine/threonine-protein phosphatase 2A regulatory subunit B'' subunit beta [Heterocephalus glaber]|uniref:Serine/threonine-protein phosphatase 2A regulatory subunit B'' subunit beta n=1 Tax=Heterocephalus glaber TaxID=10181 RepID=G5BIY8_HETGA|nr:Serine/threonine-protein phosphatase 2A regulatory subunit B'' subunit beta [Heterocephalus glaber]
MDSARDGKDRGPESDDTAEGLEWGPRASPGHLQPDDQIFSDAITRIEYWFRCMDLDGDGAQSMFELEFYAEQSRGLDPMGIEPLPFEDCACQVLDLAWPRCPGWRRRRSRALRLGAVHPPGV